MVFSSLVFLYLFLPIALAGHFLLPLRLRNLWLLSCSLLFYTWGEGWYVAVMVAGIAFNYLAGLAIGAYASGSRQRRIVLTIAVVLDVIPLLFFKYTGFLIANLSAILAPIGIELPPIDDLHLPIGISFFTFQGISYLADVYRGDIAAQRNPIAYGAYKAMFPQLIAGPIVRYADIASDLGIRKASMDDVAAGIERFVVGLGKKVLLADLVAIPADRAFSLGAGHLGTGLAWVGIWCYALQIYLDFSAYSDMAIGLGRILGFKFPENFAYPYTATSIRDFWRRWHISLSSWFRDYVYFPLGGNRIGTARTMLNLVVVFVLCGLWHGAQWTFIVWGLWHGVFLAAEHAARNRNLGSRLPAFARIGYVLFVVLIGWVLFRADSLAQATEYLGALAGIGNADDTIALHETCSADVVVAIVIGSAAAFGIVPLISHWVKLPTSARSVQWALVLARPMAVLAIGSVSTACIISKAYSPFIYCRF